jgi:hypothetical protein
MLDWGKYIAVATRYQYRARPEDREDLSHTIALSLADTQIRLDNDGGGQLSDIAMLRIASYECHRYWRQLKRQLTVLSLNNDVEDGDGNTTELIDTLADDKALDLSAWIDARTWLLKCSKRLILIASKRLNGAELDNKDRQYLSRFRRKEQKELIPNVTKSPSRCPIYSGSPV